MSVSGMGHHAQSPEHLLCHKQSLDEGREGRDRALSPRAGPAPFPAALRRDLSSLFLREARLFGFCAHRPGEDPGCSETADVPQTLPSLPQG